MTVTPSTYPLWCRATRTVVLLGVCICSGAAAVRAQDASPRFEGLPPQSRHHVPWSAGPTEWVNTMGAPDARLSFTVYFYSVVR